MIAKQQYTNRPVFGAEPSDAHPGQSHEGNEPSKATGFERVRLERPAFRPCGMFFSIRNLPSGAKALGILRES
jgi:hypothetical protein